MGWRHEIRVSEDELTALGTLGLALPLGRARQTGTLRLDSFDVNALEAAAQERVRDLAGITPEDRRLRGHLAAVTARLPSVDTREVSLGGLLLRMMRRGMG